tara:strand:- start:1247 stop:1549 length:303 start_codon:yes stop_codon:yes gene_type:complete
MIDGSQKITAGGKDYFLRLNFAATKNIEMSLSKPLLHVNNLSLFEVSYCISEMASVSEDEAFDIVSELGIEAVGVAIKLLIIETYNPEKKPRPAAKDPAN